MLETFLSFAYALMGAAVWMRVQQDDNADVDAAEGKPFTSYVMGIVAWASLGLSLGIVVMITGLCLCIGRCILPIIGVETCGKRYPTPMLGRLESCGLGFRPVGTKLSQGFGYGLGRWIARGCILLTLALSVVIVMIGYNNGVQQVAPALKALPASTQAAMDAMLQLKKPIGIHLRNTGTVTLSKTGSTILDIANRYTNFERVWRLGVCGSDLAVACVGVVHLLDCAIRLLCLCSPACPTIRWRTTPCISATTTKLDTPTRTTSFALPRARTCPSSSWNGASAVAGLPTLARVVTVSLARWLSGCSCLCALHWQVLGDLPHSGAGLESNIRVPRPPRTGLFEDSHP
jgi:hypothetical protein